MPSKPQIEIVFTRPKSFWAPVSWLIRLLLWAPYDHCALKLGHWFFEALSDGSVFTSEIDFHRKNKIIAAFEITLSEEQFSRLKTEIHKLKGIPYDWKGVMAIGLYRLFGIRLILRKNQNTLFCSGLVYTALSALGLIEETATPQLLDPKRALRLLEANRVSRVR